MNWIDWAFGIVNGIIFGVVIREVYQRWIESKEEVKMDDSSFK